MATSTQNRRAAQPVSVTYCWDRRLWDNPLDARSGLLDIDGKPYGIIALYDRRQLVGLQLVKPDGKTYELPADLSECNCPDSLYRERQGGCKHRKALREALAELTK